MYPLPASLTLCQFIPFTTEKMADFTNEGAKVAHKAGRNLPSRFFHNLLFQ